MLKILGVSDTGARACKKIRKHILFIIPVERRSIDRAEHFIDMGYADRQFRHYLCHFLKGKIRRVSFLSVIFRLLTSGQHQGRHK